MAISKGGDLYTWGSNAKGQLGHGGCSCGGLRTSRACRVLSLWGTLRAHTGDCADCLLPKRVEALEKEQARPQGHRLSIANAQTHSQLKLSRVSQSVYACSHCTAALLTEPS